MDFWNVGPQASRNPLAVSPLYTLPTFCTYDAATDTISPTGFDTAYPSEVGATVYNVSDSGVVATNQAALQGAIDTAAALSDAAVIKVAGGGHYGKILLKARPSADAGWIIIRPDDTSYASLPSPSAGTVSGGTDNRIRPAHASYCWRLSKQATGSYDCALETAQASGVGKYRLVGMYATPESGTTGLSYLVYLDWYSGGTPYDAADQPHHVYLDRCLLRGNPTITNAAGVQDGVRVHGNDNAVLDCYIDRIGKASTESHGITWGNGQRFKVTNTYVSGGSIGMLLGGGDTAEANLSHRPADVFVDRCHIYKPLNQNPYDATYAGTALGCKNSWETKELQRGVVQNSVIENCWYNWDQWQAIAVKSQPQYESEYDYTYTNNLTFRHLLLLNVYGGVMIQSTSGATAAVPAEQSAQRIDLHNIVVSLGDCASLKDPGWSAWAHGLLYLGLGAVDTRLRRITVASADLETTDVGHMFTTLDGGGAYGPTTGLEVTDVVVPWPDLIWGNLDNYSTADGNTIIDANLDAPSLRVSVFTPDGESKATVTAPRHTVITATQVQAMSGYDPGDLAGSGYTVTHASFQTTGTGGTRDGADWATISARIAGVRET